MKQTRRAPKHAGLRLIRLWVPDTRSKRFAAECRRQSRLLKGDPVETGTLEFMARAAAWKDDSAEKSEG
jgi:hypothetical protein